MYGNSISDPWVLLRVLNDIASPNYQWGNRDITQSNINKFVKALSSCGLFDAPCLGPSFTWVTYSSGRICLRRKLDRALWNLEAELKFPKVKALTLSHTHSDHHSILFMGHAGGKPTIDKRPFRFEVAWLSRSIIKISRSKPRSER